MRILSVAVLVAVVLLALVGEVRSQWGFRRRMMMGMGYPYGGYGGYGMGGYGMGGYGMGGYGMGYPYGGYGMYGKK